MRHLLILVLLAVAVAASRAADAPHFTEVAIEPVTNRPCLLLDPDDLPAAVARFARQPAYATLDLKRYDQTWQALASTIARRPLEVDDKIRVPAVGQVHTL